VAEILRGVYPEQSRRAQDGMAIIEDWFSAKVFNDIKQWEIIYEQLTKY
jgi:hypothetical protein